MSKRTAREKVVARNQSVVMKLQVLGSTARGLKSEAAVKGLTIGKYLEAMLRAESGRPKEAS